jgi:thymidylate synthase
MFTNFYNNAQEAFEELYDLINNEGYYSAGTKVLHNVGIQIQNPLDNEIKTKWRKWSKDYAEFEWDWYLSKNPNAEEISQRASIWKSLMDENGNVNSNYGYQWSRADQLTKVIEMLKTTPTTRRASISIYDGKEINEYPKDTPCTYAINFYIENDNKLSMQVMMRSNDLVYGFCNDQFCFSKLQKYVADELNLEIGTYFHFACNMHIYEKHYNMKHNYLKNE